MVAIITSSTAVTPAGFDSSSCPIIYSLTSSSTSSSLLSSTGARTFLSSSFSSSSSLPFKKSLPLSSPLPSIHAIESATAFRRLVNLRKSTNRFQPDKIVNDDIIVDILDSTLVSFFFGSGSLQDDRVALSQRLKFCCYLVITLFFILSHFRRLMILDKNRSNELSFFIFFVILDIGIQFTLIYVKY